MKKPNFIIVIAPVVVVYAGCQMLITLLSENAVVTAIALSFQSAITILGVIVILYQIKRGHEINELDFFIKLKNSFLNDKQNMELLGKLQYFDENGGEEIVADNIEITKYLAFFDSVYIAYKNKIISIKMIDETFSYYFFLAVHNKKVQDLELIKYATFYKNIFLLYDKWLAYRKKVAKHDIRVVADIENSLSKRYTEYHTLINS